METAEDLDLLVSIYADLRLYVNFFQFVLKLIGKKRIDGRTVRTDDQAQTCYRRVLAEKTIPIEIKAHLTAQYVQLNTVTLRASIDSKVARLWKIVR